MAKIEKPKFNIGLLMDKMFRRTIFLRPLPDRSLQAIDITGSTDDYLRDQTGATSIDPSCIMRVRGIKRVDYVALKLSDATNLLNLFESQKVIVTPPSLKIPAKDAVVTHPNFNTTLPGTRTFCRKCGEEHITPEYPMEVPIPDTPIHIDEYEVPVPTIEVIVPSENPMTERTLGDMLNESEEAGKLQGTSSPEADKKMTYILLLGVAAVVVGIVIFFKINGAAPG